MANNGYIRLHRSFLDWEWYSDPAVRAVFLHLLLIANYAETDYKGITVSPGQAITTLPALEEAVKLSRKQVRNALDKLKRTGEVAVKTTNKYSVVTLANWGKYQDSNFERADKRALKGADKGHSTQEKKEKRKEAKEIKKDKEYINNIINIPPYIPPTGGNEHEKNIDDLFDGFWKEYPKKVNKINAVKAFNKLKPSLELTKTIIAAVKRAKSSKQWTDSDGQYIPHASTYLNGKRWEDEGNIPSKTISVYMEEDILT